ncbi:MAG: hypothetical protein ACLR23_11565 [Clostridia bacterium]
MKNEKRIQLGYAGEAVEKPPEVSSEQKRVPALLKAAYAQNYGRPFLLLATFLPISLP